MISADAAAAAAAAAFSSSSGCHSNNDDVEENSLSNHYHGPSDNDHNDGEESYDGLLGRQSNNNNNCHVHRHRKDDDDDDDASNNNNSNNVVASSLAMLPPTTTSPSAAAAAAAATTDSICSSSFQQLTWLEVSGSCGDLGTLIPLLVALARERRIHLAPTLWGTGVVHLITGWYWNLPMPVQPMHMIAAQALAGGGGGGANDDSSLQSPTQVATAGVGMGISFLMLQFGGIEFLHKCIPKSVIGGLQLGVGWNVALKGLSMIQTTLPWWGQLDCIVTAILVSAGTLYGLRGGGGGVLRSSSSSLSFSHATALRTTSSPLLLLSTTTRTAWQRFQQEPPVGLFLFGVGVILAALQLYFDKSSSSSSSSMDLHLRPEPLWVNALKDATWNDWTAGLGNGTLPQLPLTTLNSCLSVCLLAETLFPPEIEQEADEPMGNRQRRHAVSHKSVCWSIGLMNTLLCPLGVFPHCHGAGGLAGQVRLGATTGVSMMVLGLFKIILSLWAAQGSLLVVLDALPVSVLGVLVALSGHELALTGIKAVIQQHQTSASLNNGSSRNGMQLDTNSSVVLHQDITIALITAMVIVGTGMAHVGALCGWLTYLIHGNGVVELWGHFGNGARRRRRRQRRRMNEESSSSASLSQNNGSDGSDEGGDGPSGRGEYSHLSVESEDGFE